MLKFILCEDNMEELDTASKTIVKTMMNYDIDYKICKFRKYSKELTEEINNPFNSKIYILDIELPIVSGLEIASEIREEDDESSIIFVTAHPECKNDIFYSRLQATDFISKHKMYPERLKETIEYILDKKYKNKTFEFTTNHIHTIVKYKEINYIEKCQMQNKCRIHLVDGQEKTFVGTVTEIKEKLGNRFYRSHKSCIVNLDNIKEVDFPNFTIYFENGDSTNLLAPNSRKELRKHAISIDSDF